MNLRRFLRDRLLWYVLAGVLLFVADYYIRHNQAREIRITLPLVQKLAVQWQSQVKRLPNPQELDMLIEGHIREEILMREAIDRGLDVDDVIIRRRLAQKMEFTMGEGFDAVQPDENMLRQFFEAHQENYRQAERLSFRHIFLGGDAEVSTSLLQALEDDPDAWARAGQPFMLQREYLHRSQNDIAEIFGNDFATALFAVPAGKWRGPIKSAYGWHMVQPLERQGAVMPRFDAIIDRVARDWANQEERHAKEKAWMALRAKYNITMEPVKE